MNEQNVEEVEKEPLFTASNVRQAVLRGLMAAVAFVVWSLVSLDGVSFREHLVYSLPDGLVVTTVLAFIEFAARPRARSRKAQLSFGLLAGAVALPLLFLCSAQASFPLSLSSQGTGIGEAALQVVRDFLGLVTDSPVSSMFVCLACAFGVVTFVRLGVTRLHRQVALSGAVIAGLVLPARSYYDLAAYEWGYCMTAALTLPLIYVAAERIDQSFFGPAAH